MRIRRSWKIYILIGVLLAGSILLYKSEPLRDCLKRKNNMHAVGSYGSKPETIQSDRVSGGASNDRKSNGWSQADYYTPAAKHARYVRMVEEDFGDALQQLGLSPAVQDTIKRLIVSRYEEAQDISDSLFAIPKPKESESEYVEKLRRVSLDKSDKELQHWAGNAWPTLKQILGLSLYWTRARSVYADSYKKVGLDLSLTQTIAIAEALKLKTDEQSDNMGRSLVIDPKTGLSEGDRQMLGLLSSVLSPQQMELLRDHMVSINTSNRK